jgi:3-hydroxyacyl-CoA dehydrogenase/enoyl-CoA hydratase/3-hydroxybutyryl-CoA epimerase/3-hydroxyacyl-CoA dehydrogenase/enoyl-CoA hydratase/3-hydroxybutyryl-CoA epimerase/enoyl-CoA isomerase
MLLGPFAMFDMVGLDTAMRAGLTLWGAFPERCKPSPLLPKLVKRKRLGRSCGRGFYAYPDESLERETDPAVDRIVAPYLRTPQSLTQEEITNRLFLPMLLEATRALEDGVVRQPWEVDLGLIYGLGFPAFRGGLLYWADTVGASRIVEGLKPLESLGDHITPTPLLLDMAEKGGKFYDA